MYELGHGDRSALVESIIEYVYLISVWSLDHSYVNGKYHESHGASLVTLGRDEESRGQA